jgi:hypothetical protein
MGEAEEQQAGKPRSARVNEDKGGSSNYEGLPELGRHVITTGIGQADNRKTTDATATAEHAERTNRNEMSTHILTDDEAIFAEPAELDPEATRRKLERNAILLKTTLGKQDNYATEGTTLRLITRRYNVVMRGKVESNTRFENIQKATTVAGPTTPSKGTQYNNKGIAPSGKQFTIQLVATKEVFEWITLSTQQAKLEALIDGMTITQALGQSRKPKRKNMTVAGVHYAHDKPLAPVVTTF